MILSSLPFQAVVQESSPSRQTCAFHGVALAQLCTWAGNSTLAFVGGICTCVKCSTQETACLSSLEEGAVTSFSVLVGLQFLEKKGLLCYLSEPPSAVDRSAEEAML